MTIRTSLLSTSYCQLLHSSATFNYKVQCIIKSSINDVWATQIDTILNSLLKKQSHQRRDIFSLYCMILSFGIYLKVVYSSRNFIYKLSFHKCLYVSSRQMKRKHIIVIQTFKILLTMIGSGIYFTLLVKYIGAVNTL